MAKILHPTKLWNQRLQIAGFFVAMFTFLIIITSAVVFKREQEVKSKQLFPQKLNRSEVSKQGLSQDTQSAIDRVMSEREYHISYDKQKGRLQSPNRKQGLRAYYKPGIFSIENRIDSAGHNFNLELTTIGVFADGNKIYSPQKDAQTETNDNTLKMEHPGFTEEYVNSEEGIRQNFIIQNAPDHTEELQVRLSAEGLRVNSFTSNELTFSDDKNTQLTYRDLNCWDANHQALPATLSCTNQLIELTVDVRNATYPVTIDPLVVNGTPANANALLESNQAGAALGASISSAGDVNGDGYSDVIAGAEFYDNGQQEEGAVFVFHGSAAGIITAPAAILEGNLVNASLGAHVSGAGDVNGDGYSDIVVGAYSYSNGQYQEGAFFVYHGSATGINPTPAFKVESNIAGEALGFSVAGAGDVNADGYSDIIVGTPYHSNGQNTEGVFYVYHGSPAGIKAAPATVKESNVLGGAYGSSVAGAGDVNADGYSDIIVGAAGYQNGQIDEGAAMIFYGSNQGIKTNTSTILESNQTETHMGRSVASAGDVNGDGYSDVVVGAEDFDNGQADEGVAFVYYGSAAGISTNAAATLEGNQTNAHFGASVASAGDVNGDGYSDIIVGGQASAYFVFQGSKTGISNIPVSKITHNQDVAVSRQPVASAGDLNGDGYSDIIVGAGAYDNGQVDEGIVLVFHGGASGISTTETASFTGSSSDGNLGWSVSSAGDVNGDGYDDVIAGAPKESKGQALEGIAYLFYGSATGINVANPVILQADKAGAWFGLSVSGAGDVNGDGYADVVVGAEDYNDGQVEQGAFYIFLGSPGGIATAPVQSFKGDRKYARLGCSVSSAGDLNGDGFGDVVVGARGYIDGDDFEGALFIYYGSATGLKVNPQMIQTNQNNGYLGTEVSNAGDVNGDGYADVIASVASIDGVQVIGGMAVLVFHGSPTGLLPNYVTAVKYEVPQAGFAAFLSVAGDVNGDGFSDIIVGAPKNDQTGTAHIYHGSPAGINSIPALILSGDNGYGWGVSGAGDVNGDGYSDVIVGAKYYTNGQANEGGAFLYHGSATGINSNPVSKTETNQQDADVFAVSDAGDVNGDGYSDVIVGSIGFDAGANTNAGKIYIYQGNNGGGFRNNLRLYNQHNLSTIINHGNMAETGFGFGLFGKPFLGRGNVKILWETKKEGESFSNINSTAFTDIEPYGQISNGTESKYATPKLGKATKIRARFKYDLTRALTGQVYSPWRYLPSYTSGNILAQSGALPVHLSFFTAERFESKVQLNWQTASEINSEHFEIQHSTDGKAWKQIGKVNSAIESNSQKNYSFDHSMPVKGDNFYRLKMVDQDGTFALSRIRTVNFGGEDDYVFYPNPVVDWLYVNKTKGTDLKRVTIFNVGGNRVLDLSDYQIQTLPNGAINLQKFPTGIYLINATHYDGSVNTFKIVKK